MAKVQSLLPLHVLRTNTPHTILSRCLDGLFSNVPLILLCLANFLALFICSQKCPAMGLISESYALSHFSSIKRK
jgi:hypothetical protein